MFIVKDWGANPPESKNVHLSFEDQHAFPFLLMSTMYVKVFCERSVENVSKTDFMATDARRW